jgi:DNA-binding SARP family transcriptional activator
MKPPPPFLFSLLILPLLAGMIMFVVIRRPREPLTWAFAGIMAGLIVFYLADVVLFQPGISLYTGLDWQFIQIQGANLTILSALFLNFWLRDQRLQPWQGFIVGFIVLRMATVMIWQLSLLRPDTPAPCLSLYGVPRFTCSPIDHWVSITDAIAGIGVAVLFFSTALQAVEPKRQILRRYIVWATALIVVGSTSLQVLTLAGESGLGVITGQPATLVALLIGLRLFLALEEMETGIRFPVLGWRVAIWFVLLFVALMVDLTWGWLNAPIWTLLVVAAGVAGGAAFGINSLSHRVAQPPAPSQTDGAASIPIASPPSALRLYLFGPMRVVRQGETLPNTTNVWRSVKTRSLLAWLALGGEAGATQVEIVDALWPVGWELDGDAERSSLAAFRSYLSTLRRVLDPDGPRGSDRFIRHEGERYSLRPDEVWVDVWQFEALAGEAEALLRQGRGTEGLACWRQAVALYAPPGLLPDESYLPATLIESARESLRQRWLAGLRCLARAAETPTGAAVLWETIHQAEPLDQEATLWLVQHYRGLGNASGLRMVLQRRRDAEAEMEAL